MEKDDSTNKKVQEVLVSGTTAIAGGLVGGPLGAALGGLSAIAPVLMDTYRHRMQNRAQKLWEKIVANSASKSEEEIANEINLHADEPYIYETIVQSVQKLLEAADDSVVPSLGVLAAEYLREEKRPDSFFRGLSQLLCDLSNEEFTDFQELIAVFYSAPVVSEAIEAHISLKLYEGPGNNTLYLGIRKDTGITPSGFQSDFLWYEPIAHMQRLFHLLKSHHLAQDNAQIDFGTSILTDKALVRRIYSITKT